MMFDHWMNLSRNCAERSKPKQQVAASEILWLPPNIGQTGRLNRQYGLLARHCAVSPDRSRELQMLEPRWKLDRMHYHDG
jgi:hypothetical protein